MPDLEFWRDFLESAGGLPETVGFVYELARRPDDGA